jgi:hypothetical protein
MNTLSKIVASAAVTSSVFALSASADTYNAQVDVLTALGQSQATQLEFGRFAKPGSGLTVSIDMESADGSTSITGDASDKTQYGSTAVGVITVTGDENEDVDIDIAAGNTASGGLLLSELNAKYGSASQVDASGTADIAIDDAAAPTVSGTALKVAGKLTIDNNVSTGADKTFDYTVTLSYD